MTFSVQICHWYQHYCHLMLTASSMAPCFHEVKTAEKRCDMTLLVMWYCWHMCKHHMPLVVLSMSPFCLLGWDDWNKLQHNFLVTWCQCWYHMTLIALSMPLLHLLLQDALNEMQHDFFSHLLVLVLESASCDANGIINKTIAFIRIRKLKQCATYLFWSFDAIDAGVSVIWYQWYHQWHHSIC